MKTAVIIQFVLFEDLGSFASVLTQAGFEQQTLYAPVTDFQQLNPLAADLWLVLGGPIGVYDDLDYPFLPQVTDLLKIRLVANLPTLGICLGCQLMAAALGAKVYASGHQEIGWKSITLTAIGQQSCLSYLDQQAVLHWHGDTFDLPDGARLLASSDLCQQQAVQIGRSLALQFHPEVTEQGLQHWLVSHTHEINHAGLSVRQLRQESAHHAKQLQQQGTALLNHWLETVKLM